MINTELFWSKVEVTPDCWLWLAGRSSGYGQFHVQGYPHKAHRVAWELVHGAIPKGHDIHHKCHNPTCVNPEHLCVIERRQHRAEHAAEGGSAAKARHANRNTCVNGHALTPDNIYSLRGSRRCRQCRREGNQRLRSRRAGS